jgi:hypothetical protein
MKKEGKKEGKRLAKSKPQFIRNHDSWWTCRYR